MFTEKDRALLAPLLARTRTTQAQVAAATQEATAADGRLKKSEDGTDWRDHLFGGLFSREPARARAYHDARRACAGRQPARAQEPLQRLERQLNQAIATMRDWRTEATAAEASAVAAARDRLINESSR